MTAPVAQLMKHVQGIAQLGLLVAVCMPAGAQAKVEIDDPDRGILETMLPASGPVPSMTPHRTRLPLAMPDGDRSREWRAILKSMQKKHFRSIRRENVRLEGIAELRKITDSAAFQPMFEILEGEKDDVRSAMLEHFSTQGEAGQAALAWVAIHAEDKALRHAATLLMVTPVGNAVLSIMDHALRDTRHAVVSHAATLANALDIIEAIPLLIFNQATQDDYDGDTGDLAWIAVGTQKSYVQDLVPVVGNNVGAFNPIIGTVAEGFVLAIQDAVVVVYRTEVHFALRNLSTRDWGRSTDHLGWDMKQWWTWYNDEYVPYKRAQAAAEPSAGSAIGVAELVDRLHENASTSTGNATGD
ncbi:MAG: hypothetical protein P8J45_08855 [Phycisphaerales bacterium]|nr:hypothetical protein [Phycisphaerales bacterium]